MPRGGFKLEAWRKPTPGNKFSTLKIAHETVAFSSGFSLESSERRQRITSVNKHARNFLCKKQTLTNRLFDYLAGELR